MLEKINFGNKQRCNWSKQDRDIMFGGNAIFCEWKTKLIHSFLKFCLLNSMLTL